LSSSNLNNIDRENLKEIATDLNKIQDELYDLKKIISLSADIRKYKIFTTTIPHVSKIVKGVDGTVEFWIPDEERGIHLEYRADQVKFCLDFTLGLALKHNE